MKRKIPQPLGTILALIVAAELMGLLTYLTAREMALARNLPALPVLPPSEFSAVEPAKDTFPSGESPLQLSDGPPPRAWDGVSRVNLLILGLDHRAGEELPPRADALLLLSLDPQSQTAAILSLPGNLWVNIPGFDPYFLHTAYSIGAYTHAPGGGPGLTMATIERLLDLRIDYYVEVDFRAFETWIDEIGGVEVEIAAPIEIDPIGAKPSLILEAGARVLTGELALAYARAPNPEDNHFDRADRAQQLMLGIRSRILSVEILPTLIEKAPILYTEVAAGVHTNLSLAQIVQMAWLGSQIPEESIRRGIVSEDQATVLTFPDGQTLLKPVPEAMRRSSNQLFTTYGEILPAADGGLAELVQAEAARVAVFNGTATPGLASRTAEDLQSQGIFVSEFGNADKHYEQTALVDYTGNPHTVEYLLDLLDISAEQVYLRYDLYSQIDIALFLGEDEGEGNAAP